MDLDALDQASDYSRVFEALFPGAETLLRRGRFYATPPSRPEEDVKEQRFSVHAAKGVWKDHKTGESGNMLSLAKEHGPSDWKERWVAACPQAGEILLPSGARVERFYGPNDFDPDSFASNGPGAERGMSDPALLPTREQRKAEPKKKAKSKRKETFAQQAERGQRLTTEEQCKPFCDAWRVSMETLVVNGAWGHMFDRGRLAGKPQMFFPMLNPVTGGVEGIKDRGLEPIYSVGKKLLKSKNEAGSSSGVFPWHSDMGSKPLLLVEGEKDWAVAQQDLGHRFDVVANMGGAGCFKSTWVKAVTSRWSDIYICYDPDSAGASGARKASLLLRGADRTVYVVSLPNQGHDIFSLLREVEDGAAVLDKAIKDAEPLREISAGEVDQFIKVRCSSEDLRKDDYALSLMLYAAMRDNGALFYQEDHSRAFCAWRSKVYEVNGHSHAWNLLIADYTGMMFSGAEGRRLHLNLTSLACERGKPVEAGRWTRFHGGSVYLQLYNDEQQLVKISSEDIQVVPNGWDDVVFLPSQHVPAVKYMPDATFNCGEAEQFYNWIWTNLNCSPRWQLMVGAIFKVLFLYDFVQTHPVIRFQGPSGSGKSTAQQIFSLILYGHKDLAGDVTPAAMFRLARDMPVILQDDLEDRNIRKEEWLSKFYLRAAMGGLRFKSAADSEDTVGQRVNCWIINSGIHGIADDNSALNERLIVVPVRDISETVAPLMAMEIFHRIQERRDVIWNYLYREMQRMLHSILDESASRMMMRMPRDQRPRLHEFYVLMSIARGHVNEPDPMVLEWLSSASRGEGLSVVESSHVSELLYYLPSFLGNGGNAEGHESARHFRDVTVKKDGGLWRCQIDAHQLHAVLSRMSKDTGLRYYMQNAKRLSGEVRALRRAGASEGLVLHYDPQQRRANGRIVRLWTLEIEADSVRRLPMHTGSPSNHETDGNEGEDDIPF